MISGTYSSVQSLQVGDVVQLVLGQDGFVMKVYEKSTFAYELNNLTALQAIAVFDIYTITVQETNRGNVVVQAWTGGISVWSQTITALTIFNVAVVAGAAGVFLLINADGVITLPNSVVIQQSSGTINILMAFALSNGQMTAYTTIQNPTIINLTYDNANDVSLIYGNATVPLIIGGAVIIDQSGLYSFAVFLSPTLTPSTILAVSGIVITQLAAGSGNIAYSVTSFGSTTLFFFGADGTTWSHDLGVFTITEIAIYPGFVATLGFGLIESEFSVFQYTLTGVQINMAVLPFIGFIILTQFAFNGIDFILYAVITNSLTNPTIATLAEYNVFDDVIAWSINIPVTTTLLAGVNSLVAIGFDGNTVDAYGKRFPAVVGAVSAVLWQPGVTGGTGACPPGFTMCTGSCPNCFGSGCTGPSGATGGVTGSCCPNNVLPNCLSPYIVQVDFTLTTAFAPVIPGQEYFLDASRQITTNEVATKYIGTALDSQRVLMLATGSLAP
jgi:hypothetical protein